MWISGARMSRHQPARQPRDPAAYGNSRRQHRMSEYSAVMSQSRCHVAQHAAGTPSLYPATAHIDRFAAAPCLTELSAAPIAELFS